MSWHIYNKDTEFQTGDIVETSASKWFLVHFGVIFFKPSADGKVAYISHCPLKEGRPAIETLESFKKKRTIYRYFRNHLTEAATDEGIIKRSEHLQQYEYDATSFNCEDYVKHVINGAKLGLDLRVGIAITVVVIIVVIVIVVKLLRR